MDTTDIHRTHKFLMVLTLPRVALFDDAAILPTNRHYPRARSCLGYIDFSTRLEKKLYFFVTLESQNKSCTTSIFRYS